MTDPRIKVLHLLPTIGAGGVERLFAWMSGRWSDRYRIIAGLLYRGHVAYGSELAAAGVELLQLGNSQRGSLDLTLVPRLSRTLRERAIRIVHTHNVTAQVCAQACRLAGHGQALVFHQHKSPTRLQRWIERSGVLLPRPDVRIAVSSAAKAELVSLGIAESTIEVVPNGIPLRAPAATRAPADPAGPRIVTVTRLSEEKGVEFLIRAMPAIVAAAPLARLRIVGDGPQGPTLRALSAALGVAGAVDFAGFHVDPRPLLDESDVFVLPSLQEGFGLALVEAMQAELPCVATHAGGIPEIVEDGVHGLLVPPGDAPAIADAVLRVVRTPDLARALAVEGGRAAHRYDLRRTVLSIESTYERLLAAEPQYGSGRRRRWAH